jgi:hypothetical protein
MRDLRFRKDDPTLGEYLFALALVGLLVVMIGGLWAMAFDDAPPLALPGVSAKADAPAPPKTRASKETTAAKKASPKVKTDPRFRTCGEATARGYGNYRPSDPEYRWYPRGDRDGDGLACDLPT